MWSLIATDAVLTDGSSRREVNLSVLLKTHSSSIQPFAHTCYEPSILLKKKTPKNNQNEMNVPSLYAAFDIHLDSTDLHRVPSRLAVTGDVKQTSDTQRRVSLSLRIRVFFSSFFFF